jgi:branched-chain amino acid transport system substrate-binding protein
MAGLQSNKVFMLTRLRLALLALFLCLMAGAVVAEDKIRLVQIYSKTGRLAFGARDGELDVGARLAVEDINARGGVLGKPLELIEIDSQSTVLGAKAAAIKAIGLRPAAVIGERASSLSLVLAPLLQEAGVPMLSPNSSHADVTLAGDYIFRLCFIDRDQGQAMAQFAIGHLKLRRAAILVNVSQKHSEELARHFEKRFIALGGTVALRGEYLQEATSFSELLERVKAAGVDVLFVPGYSKDAGLLIRQARQMGVEGVFLGGDAWGNKVPSYAGRASDGSYRTANWHRGVARPASQDFVRRFEQRYGFELSEGQVLTYDAVFVAADAIRRANSTEGRKVRDALAATKNGLDLVAGAVRFDQERKPNRPVIIVKYVNGQMTYADTVLP